MFVKLFFLLHSHVYVPNNLRWFFDFFIDFLQDLISFSQNPTSFL
jgi:hypothetical protein